jgi:hypothetical protein
LFLFLLREFIVVKVEMVQQRKKGEQKKRRKGINGRYEERRHKASRRERQEMAR